MSDHTRIGGGVRQRWSDLPAAVRAAVEDAAGSRVVATTSCAGGFSPGVATVLTLSDGSRRFVKAASASPNPDTPVMHRTEITVNRTLPPAVPAPRLLWHRDDGEWVVLLFEYVDAAPPTLPWDAAELDRVLRAVADAHAALTPAPAGSTTAAQRLGDDLGCWRQASQCFPAGLDEWSARHVDTLAEHESRWVDAVDADTLAHLDLRADNLLVDATRAWLVDWPGAARAAGWADVVGMAPSVAMQGGPSGAELLRRYPGDQPDDDQLVAFLAAVAGYFVVRALHPPPPGIPTVRAFQAAQGRAAVSWLAELLRLR